MFNRLKTLVLMQLAEKIDVTGLENKGRFAVKIIIRILTVVLLSIAIKFVISFFQKILYIEVTSSFVLAIVFLTQVISIVSVCFGLVNTLYTSTDNTLLLSLPTKYQEIFLSKLIVYYIYEIKKNMYFLLPLFIGYALQFSAKYNFGFFYGINVVVLTLIIPLFPVLIGAILSIPFVFITNYLKRHTLLNVLTFTAIISFLFYIVFIFVNQLPPNQRFNDILNSINNMFTNGINTLNKYALFYTNINNILFAGNKGSIYLINYGIIFAILIGLILLVTFVSMPTYFSLATHSFQTATKKKYKGKIEVENNTFMVFLKKELKTLFRSSDQIISSFIYLLALPFLLYILNIVYRTFKLSEFGTIIIFGVNMLVGLILLLASNVASATAISREGSEFYLMKIAPSKTSKMAWAKVAINLVISSITVIVVSVTLELIGILDPFYGIGLGLVFLFVTWGHILWSYQLDLMNPKIHDYASNQNIDNNPNATKSILLGTVIAFLATGLSIWLRYDGYVSGWIRMVLIALGFFLARLYLFINTTKYYFEDISL